MIHIEPITAFSDNYIWAISNTEKKHYTIVDPGHAAPVLNFLHKRNAQLTDILITHHHSDHTGGIKHLLKAFPEIKIHTPAEENIPFSTHVLHDNDTVHIESLNINFQVMFIPGHTAGHIAYYQDNTLFCGDTLFAAGCGRVFDGTHASLYHSLQKIAKLPPETLIYCAHEYTLDNIGFALWVEPNSLELLQRQANTYKQMDNNEPSIPSTLALELTTNPFLRTHLPHIIELAERHLKKKVTPGYEVFKMLRDWKDTKYD